jgi:hypothetical protein
MGRVIRRGSLIANNADCVFLYEAQSQDTAIAGNRARGFINGTLVSSSSPTFDTTDKQWGTRSMFFTRASSQYLKAYRDLQLTVTAVLANNQFTVASATDYSTYFIAGKIVTIAGSTNNNGTYTVVSSSFSAATTTVTISQTTLVTGGILGTVGHTNPITQIGTGDFSLEACFRTPSTFLATYTDICGADYTNNFALEVISGGANSMVFYTSTSTYTLLSAVSTATDYHVLITRKNGTIKIWVDGVLVISAANTANIVTNNDFYVGSDGDTTPSFYWDGNIQRVALWKKAIYYNPRITTAKLHFSKTASYPQAVF